MLENTRRPSRTAVTMVVKLSSVMTMSEALFVTSVPETPIAMPISAVRILGASLMPSPVIATTLSFFCKARTIIVLCLGLTRANTLYCAMDSKNALSAMASISAPVITSDSFWAIVSRLAMAKAVSG